MHKYLIRYTLTCVYRSLLVWVCVWVGESEHLSKLENLWALFSLMNASFTLFCLCPCWLDLFIWMCASLRTFSPSDELFSYSQYTHQAQTDKPKHSHYNQMCVIWVCVCVDQLLSLCFNVFMTKQEESNFPVHTPPSAKSLNFRKNSKIHSQPWLSLWDIQTCTNTVYSLAVAAVGIQPEKA